MCLFLYVVRTIFGVFLDWLTFIWLCFRPTASVAEALCSMFKQAIRSTLCGSRIP
jgi:hypothetical protein